MFGWLSRLWGSIEARFPDATYAVAMEDLREGVAETRRVVAEAAAERARLAAEVREDAAVLDVLAQQVEESLAQGDRDAAGEAALRLETLENGLADKRTRLERAEKAYREAIERATAARAEFGKRAEELGKRRAQLQTRASQEKAAAAERELKERLAGVDEMLLRLDRETAQRSAAAAGALQAREDLARAEAAEAERRSAERRSQGEQALARYATRRRAAPERRSDPPRPPGTVEKTIGPKRD